MLVDYTDQINDALIAQGKGTEFLLLFKLKNPVVISNNQLSYYRIEYSSLLKECQDKNDESFLYVNDSDYTYLTNEEADKILNSNNINLFDYYS